MCTLQRLFVSLTPSQRLSLTRGLIFTDTLRKTKDVQNTVLETLRNREATAPRDMSFGLYSVLRHSTKGTPPILNYSLPSGLVFLRLTKYLLEETNSLRFLVIAAQARLLDAPSWAPDFSQRFRPGDDSHQFISSLAPTWRLDLVTKACSSSKEVQLN